MAQYQITLDDGIVHRLFQRDGGLSTLVEQVLNQVLEAQVGEHLQAAPYERTEERQGYRNGYRERKLKTRVGPITLDVPLVRNGAFSTELFSRYQRSEQALIVALMEMVVNGVSTRKVRRVTEELCGTSFGKSTVSDLCRQLDGVVVDWNERRRLDEKLYPFLIVDALVVKVRKDRHIRSQSALLAMGVNDEGYREILGLRRRLSQGPAGQPARPTACPLHRTGCRDGTQDPRRHPGRLLQPRTTGCAAPRDAIAILGYPEPYRKRLRTTNIVERLNEEIRWRERVIRIFPNAASVARLLGALLMEQDETWSTGRKYFDMAAYWAWRRPQATAAD